ncbi:hypothetical protein E8E13_004102 [Curvularia kusanoi]|uniref:Uncharacterized protein n=1 Tax=Curvularia kusanoi TaxID=90978 RepID=A0A9P4W7V0_CURKU|nr:hypothetical protein E8E13_004102 [Curvularia kusanoi]
MSSPPLGLSSALALGSPASSSSGAYPFFIPSPPPDPKLALGLVSDSKANPQIADDKIGPIGPNHHPPITVSPAPSPHQHPRQNQTNQ